MASCDLCNDLEKKDRHRARLAFDFTPDELINSVSKQSCSSCTAILEGLRGSSEAHSWSVEQDVRRVYARCRGRHNQEPTTLNLEVYFKDDKPKVELEFFSLDTDAWKAIMPRPSTSGHPLSPKALTWVHSLLQACKERHMLCRNSRKPQLPKRVLAISPTFGTRADITLVENCQEYAPYAALSHCWGMEQTCITTFKTLEEHKKGIQWESVPRTFQDAIRFALELGIWYIWIDSLCIIQDDASDWEIESSKMADIYQHSYLTLAATASPGDSQGCYPERPLATDTFEISQAYTDSNRVGVRRTLRHWDTLEPNRLVHDYPLLSRAWVFQERLLSPRTLHFCRSELVWECREASACECGSLGHDTSPGGEYHQVLQKIKSEHSSRRLPAFPNFTLDSLDSLIRAREDELRQYSSSDHPRLKKQALLHLRTLKPLTSKKGPSELSQQWRKLVEQFSALQLTKPTDRLPALSGLCKRVKHLRGDYVAGLWVDSMWLDLLWRVDVLQRGKQYARIPRYQRPSWSWISVESTISYWDDIGSLSLGPLAYAPDGSFNPLACTVRNLRRRPLHIDYDVQLAGKNPFGEVAAAVLRVKSYYREAEFKLTFTKREDGTTNDNIPPSYEVEVEGIHIPVFVDCDFGPERLRQYTSVVLLLIHPQVALVLLPMAKPHHLNATQRAEISLLGQSSRRPGHNFLQEALDNGWERVGITKVSDTVLDLYQIDWMKGAAISEFIIL